MKHPVIWSTLGVGSDITSTKAPKKAVNVAATVTEPGQQATQ